jgi:hypothetical protein
MLKATMITKSGEAIAFVGIVDGNVDRMRAGMPMDINFAELTPPGYRISRMIVHLAHTYEQVVDDMVAGGLPENAQIRREAREMDAQG